MIIEEKEIQQFLMDRGFFSAIETKFKRDITFLESEFKIGDERIDILGIDDQKTFYVIEIKKSVIDANAIVQCMNYIIGVERVLIANSLGADIIVKGILVGEKMTDSRCISVIVDSSYLDFVSYEKSLSFESTGFKANKDYYKDLKNTAEALVKYADEYKYNEEEPV